MTELEKKITDAAQEYYTDGTSNLTDDEFDGLIEQLRKENPDSEVLKEVGWGYSVDKDTTPGKKYPHKYGRAGSLEKCRTWEEIHPEFKSGLIDVSLKIDGISVVLYYKQGELYKALTRGDGIVGIDITNKIKSIKSVPHTIDDTFTGAVRGEIVMSFENFEMFKKLHSNAKNPRNSVAGLINSQEVSTELSLLDVVVYSVIGCETSLPSKFRNISYIRKWLEWWFNYIVPYINVKITESDVTEKFQYIKDEWSDIWPSDGLVLTCNELICNNNEIIQNSQAFKFKSKTAQTKVLEIEWNMSKTGYAVPRIRVEPVQLAGTTVQYCTGYNAKYISDNHIGMFRK